MARVFVEARPKGRTDTSAPRSPLVLAALLIGVHLLLERTVELPVFVRRHKLNRRRWIRVLAR